MQELINRMEDTKGIATNNLIKSKHKTKRYYDRIIKSRSYSPGDLVYVLKEPRKNKLDRTYMRRFTSTVPARGARAPNRPISNSCL